jgi:hypothetical protein
MGESHEIGAAKQTFLTPIARFTAKVTIDAEDVLRQLEQIKGLCCVEMDLTARAESGPISR